MARSDLWEQHQKPNPRNPRDEVFDANGDS
ncbi:uncharacterized protein METZ01_LOCUS83048 [marine metagenome]|uniref:Uncharacterized protein n=1 Tax=marine metagenome TaxID=408172 RepID=A0A381UQD9_9ZZZZ